MALPDLVLTSARVVTPLGEVPGAVVVENGIITAVEPLSHVPPAARRVDTGDAVLLPGIVDTHVHANEPGRTEWEGFETATRAAAAGGVTTIVDMPLNSIPVTTTVAALAAKTQAAAGVALVDYGCWGGVVPGNLDDLGPLVDAGVLGFKCFLVPSGIDEFPAVTERDLAPPMRKAEHRERLWDGLERGIIDLVASDHSPAPRALKHLETGNFLEAWGGIASVELALAALWTRARARGRTLGDLARWLCSGPARLAGLSRKGAIAPGYDADFVVFQPDTTWSVDQRRLRQRHPITPYAGLVLAGEVRQTFLRGDSVYNNGRFPEKAAGRWIQREGV